VNTIDALKAQEILSLINLARVKLAKDTSGATSYLDIAADTCKALITGYNPTPQKERNNGESKDGMVCD
jgi:hypothetical protein